MNDQRKKMIAGGITLPLEITIEIFELIPIKQLNRSYIKRVCKKWLEMGNKIFDPSISNNHYFLWACENGKTECVKMMLRDKRVNPAIPNSWTLERASENGHTEIVRELLKDKRIDPTSRSNYSIQMASRNGHLGVVKLLSADPRVDPSDENNWAIRSASHYGYDEVVIELLKNPKIIGPVRNQMIQELAENIFKRKKMW